MRSFLKEMFPFLAPGLSTSKVLGRIDAKQFDKIMSAFLIRWEAQSRCGNELSRLQTPRGQAAHTHLTIDGKTLRATSSQPQPVHQLSCYEVDTGIVLWHCNVGRKKMRSAYSSRC